MDLDGDGFLSMYELEYFYEEQLQRMEQLGIETLPFEDCLCQVRLREELPDWHLKIWTRKKQKKGQRYLAHIPAILLEACVKPGQRSQQKNLQSSSS